MERGCHTAGKSARFGTAGAIIAVLACLGFLPGPARAASPAESAFDAGIAHFEAGEFEESMASLEEAVRLDPSNSDYHLWLGRSYGMNAQNASWFRALSLARRTLEQFRVAVELDPGNRPALEDLREYYLRAPAFLGGSQSKADEIGRRLSPPEP